MSVRQFEEERQERVRKLVNENKRLHEALKQSKIASKRIKKECRYVDYQKLQSRFFSKCEENKRLREALEFYANERNWEFHSNNFDVHDDRGMLARKTLGDSK